jgi:hypothetical protein
MNEKEKYYFSRLTAMWEKGMNGECTKADISKELFIISEECEKLQAKEQTDFIATVIEACDRSRHKLDDYKNCLQEACAMNYYLLTDNKNKASEYANKVLDARAVEKLIKETF